MSRHFSYLLLNMLAIALLATAAEHVLAGDGGVWARLKPVHFSERPIQEGAGVIGLEAPYRAEDAAIVPIIIKDLLPAHSARRIERIWLVIDNNPVPMSAKFEFSPLAGRADIATRVRVDEYTDMRVIAETDDGKLYMTKRFVKATGGCSAPASKDPAAALASLGEIRLKNYDEDGSLGEPHQMQLMLRHPNHTGLQMNQLTLLYTPAHFVKEISVDYAGRRVLDVHTTFSLSEDPSLRFYFRPRAPGALTVDVVDNQHQRFTESLRIGPTTTAQR